MIATVRRRTVTIPAMPTRRQLRRLMRRLWLRFTAPKITRQKWHPREGKPLRICDMTDPHLLNALHCGARSDVPVKKLEGVRAEALRRGLPTKTKPAWLRERNERYWRP